MMDPEALTADLIVVDEISMLDVYIWPDILFDAVKYGAQDGADWAMQISNPRWGPAQCSVEMIASGCIPVVRFGQG